MSPLPSRLGRLRSSTARAIQRGSFRTIQTLTVAVSLLGTVTVSAASVTYESWTNGHWPRSWHSTESLQTLVTFVSTIGFVTAVILLNRARQSSGTLYYLRLLLPTMSDRHGEEVARQMRAEEVVDARTVVRTLPAEAAERGVDASELVRIVVQDLESTMNDDDESTRFLVAPNMLFPTSLAFGYEFLGLREITWLEIERDRPKPREWTWDDESSADAATHQVVAHCLPRDPAPAVTSIAVSIHLVPDPFDPARAPWRDEHQLRVQIGVVPTGAEPDATGLLPFVGARGQRRSKSASPTRASAPHDQQTAATYCFQQAAEVIARALHLLHALHPDAEIHLYGRMPKTLPIGAGHVLRLMDDGRTSKGYDLCTCGCLGAYPAEEAGDQRAPSSAWSKLHTWRFAAPHGFLEDRVHALQPLLRAAPTHRAVDTEQWDRVVNLTAHDISVLADDGSTIISWPPSGDVARVLELASNRRDERIGGTNVPIQAIAYGAANIPAPVDGTMFLVSRLSAERATGRLDVAFPFDEVRDSNGQIVGCRGLARLQP